MKNQQQIPFCLMISVIIFLLVSCNHFNHSSERHTRLITENGTTVTDTLKLPVKITGEGTPLLLVPGGLTGWRGWEPFVEIFSKKPKEVIRVQLLNVQYGLENVPLPPDYSVKTESRALAGTIDSLKYTKPIDVVGWSYGALILLDYALDHPERIRTMTLIEPPAFWVLQARNLIDDEIQQTINFHNTFKGDVTEDMLAAFLLDAGILQPGQSAQEHPMWPQWISFRQSLLNLPVIYSQRDDVKRLHNFRSPVMLVKGFGSSENLHQIIDELELNIPNTKVIEMPGGHLPHIVSMDNFLRELDDFQNQSN